MLAGMIIGQAIHTQTGLLGCMAQPSVSEHIGKVGSEVPLTTMQVP